MSVKILILPFLITAYTSPNLYADKTISPSCALALAIQTTRDYHINSAGYVHTGRNLDYYLKTAHSMLLEDLRALSSRDVLVEMGPGDSNAIFEYLNSPDYNEKAKVIAIGRTGPVRFSLTSKFLNSLSKDRFEPYFGNHLETMDLSNIQLANLIIDSVGPLSYTDKFSVVLQKYVDLLKVGGVIHFITENTTQFTTHNGTLDIISWLQRIPGLLVTFEKREVLANNGPFDVITLNYLGIRIQKISRLVEIPVVEVEDWDPTTPPKRVFESSGSEHRPTEDVVNSLAINSFISALEWAP